MLFPGVASRSLWLRQGKRIGGGVKWSSIAAAVVPAPCWAGRRTLRRVSTRKLLDPGGRLRASQRGLYRDARERYCRSRANGEVGGIEVIRFALILFGERRYGAVFQIYDPQAVTLRTHGAIGDALTVRRVRGKAIAVRTRCDLVKARSVGVDDRDLCAAIGRIDGLLRSNREVEKRREFSDPEDDCIATRRPLRRDDEFVLAFQDPLWRVIADA